MGGEVLGDIRRTHTHTLQEGKDEHGAVFLFLYAQFTRSAIFINQLYLYKCTFSPITYDSHISGQVDRQTGRKATRLAARQTDTDTHNNMKYRSINRLNE